MSSDMDKQALKRHKKEQKQGSKNKKV